MSHKDEILYYNIFPYREPKGEYFAAAACSFCLICNKMVDGMNGPGNAICIECFKDIKNGKYNK